MEETFILPNTTEQGTDAVIRELLRILQESKKKEDEMCRTQEYSEALDELPKDIRKDVEERLEEWKADGVPPEKIQERLTREIRRALAAFEDKRFGIPNGSYLRMETFRIFDKLISEDAEIGNFKGVAGLFLDVNGLKAVNDLAGHHAGDEYLRRIVDVFTNGRTANKLKEKGVNVFAATNGGDEVVLLLAGEGEIKEIAEESLKEFQEEVKNKDVSDLVDVNKPETKEKLAGLDIPADFKFTASISGGSATLHEVLAGFKVNEEAGYKENIYGLENDFFKLSDKRSSEDKENFKKGLEEGNEHERFLGGLLKRNKETAEAIAENFLLKARVKELEDEIAKLRS